MLSRSRSRVARAVAGPLAAVVLAALASGTTVRATRPPGTVTIAAVGDILFDRGVRAAIERGGPDALFAPLAPLLRGADLAVGNLECPLSTRGLRAAKPFSFRGDPAYAGALARAGFDALLLANNHTLDYGRAALLDTVEACAAAGIAPVGAGRDRAEALRPVVLERNGLRVALVGFCDLFVEGTTPRDDAPGIASGDRDALIASVRSARASSDAVVVLVHWGVEYAPNPTASQRELVDRLLAAGATVVLGSHPHVLQPVVLRGRTVAAYSLGNFVFDQLRPDGAQSAVLLVTIGREGVTKVEAVPATIEDATPRPVEGDAAAAVLERLKLTAGPVVARP